MNEEGQRREKGSVRRCLSRILLVAVMTAAILNWLAPAGRASEGERPAWPADSGSRAAFLQRCSHCHEPERAYTVIDDYTQWVLTVARMAIKDRGWISSEDVKRLVGYYAEHSRFRMTLFQDRCGGCHTWEEVRGMGKNPNQWRTWIRYMSQRHVGEMTSEECELLACGLTGEG